MTLKARIIQHCKERPNEWVHKGELGRLAVLEWGYENENMGRRCRELENEGVLERRIVKGQAEYRYKRIMEQVKKENPIPQRPVASAQLTLA